MSSIKGKTILITGGTGSFGNKLAGYLESLEPARIIIFSRDEKKQYEMQKQKPDYQYIIGDVRDKDRVYYAMKNVDYVFHAAALKQVPACENFPYETVKTNIIGSNNVCEAAIENGVETVVALSTDKAVKPINAMGISKSMMEKIVCSHNQHKIDTRLACVRYGNVMWSRGSVIPLFIDLLKQGKSLTVTNPDMTRFMMSLDESVELVIHALTNAKGGEIFVKKAPAVKIIDLVKTMIRRFGNGDMDKVNVIGMRPGEKMDEVLVNEYEVRRAVEKEMFFEISPEYRPAEPNTKFPAGWEYTSANTHRLTNYDDIVALLNTIQEVVEYT